MKKFSVSLVMFTLVGLSVTASAQTMCRSLFTSEAAVIDYKYNPRISWSKQIYLKHLDLLDRYLSQISLLGNRAFIDQMIVDDARSIFFRLEGISKILEERDPAFFSKKRELYKSIEDGLGEVSLYQDLVKFSEAAQVPEFVEYFKAQETKAFANLQSLLSRKKFLVDPSATLKLLREEAKDAEKVEWNTPSKDRKHWVSDLVNFTKELEDKIEKRKFSDPDIEKGFHKLRRQLRWILVFAQSLKGLIEYEKEPELSNKIKRISQELWVMNPKMYQSKFLEIPTASVGNPIKIPYRLYVIISELVAVIGKKKTDAEIKIHTLQALSELRISDARKTEIMNTIKGKLPKGDHEAMSEQYQDLIDTSNLLKKFRHSLEEMNEE